MAKRRKRTTIKPDQEGITRRKFITGVIAASAAGGAAAVLPGAHASVVATEAVTTPEVAGLKVLTAEQAEVLPVVLNRLVPAQGEMPAAGDLKLGDFIDNLLVDAPHLRRPVLDVLGQVEAAQSRGPVSAEDLDALLTRVEHEQKSSFDVLLQITYTAYYSHPRVLRTIGWDDHDPAHSQVFDVAMLDDVRQRGPIFRDV